MLAYFVVLYLVIGIISYMWFVAATFAYYQGEFSAIADQREEKDRDFATSWAIIPALCWPVGWILLWSLSKGFKHGFHWRE